MGIGKPKIVANAPVSRALTGVGLFAGVLLVACAAADVTNETPIDGSGPGRGSGGRGGGGVSGTIPDVDFPVGGEGGTSKPQSCNRLVESFEPLPPTVALVVDRSSSMDESYGNSTRWRVLKEALLDEDEGLIKPLEGEVRFGLLMYTSTAQADTCPVLGEVEIAKGNYDAIKKVYEPAKPPTVKAETPTAEAIKAAVKMLKEDKDKSAKYIVLATDGEPDGCPGTCQSNCAVHERPGFPRDPNCGQDSAVAAVQEAWDDGIGTFVIALGDDVGADHLQAVANAGQGRPAVLGQQANWLQFTCNLPPERMSADWSKIPGDDAEAFRPENPKELAEALGQIIGSVRSCKFEMPGEVDEDRADQGDVRVDGQGLTFGDANGWKLNSKTEIEILGEACELIQDTPEIKFEAEFPCGVFIPL